VKIDARIKKGRDEPQCLVRFGKLVLADRHASRPLLRQLRRTKTDRGGELKLIRRHSQLRLPRRHGP
jgi:hypothetical protein